VKDFGRCRRSLFLFTLTIGLAIATPARAQEGVVVRVQGLTLFIDLGETRATPGVQLDVLGNPDSSASEDRVLGVARILSGSGQFVRAELIELTPGETEESVRLAAQRRLWVAAYQPKPFILEPSAGSDTMLSDDVHGSSECVVRAERLNGERIRLDGRLDEPVWERLTPATGFTQRDPHFGLPSTFETEAHFCYDAENLYIGVRCFDEDPDRIITRLSRTETDMYSEDSFAIFMDPRHDHRTGVKFGANPSGMREDSNRYNDYLRDNSWDGFWWVESQVDSLGWAAEFKIPFKNFRFAKNQAPIWGLNMQRSLRRFNEQAYWKPIARDDGSFIRMSHLGHLVGISDIETGRRFEIIPYALQGTTKSRNSDRASKPESGLDVKYALTSNLTFDATSNPDFAQVKADLDEINLTRFPTRFPEQRPFFVEGNNVFLTPLELYFSRRIGSRADILGGGKITGKAGPYSIGLVSARTGDWTYFGLRDRDSTKTEATFSVARVKRDVFDKSNIGIQVGSKEAGDAYSRVAGIDFALRPGDVVFLNSQIAASWQNDRTDGNTGITVEAARLTDLSEVVLSYRRIEPDFEINEIGFLRKEKFRGTDAGRVDLVYSPRPGGGPMQKISFSGWGDAQKPLLSDQYLFEQVSDVPGQPLDSLFVAENAAMVGAQLWISTSTRASAWGSADLASGAMTSPAPTTRTPWLSAWQRRIGGRSP
jgi:hypothetical protein